MILKQETRKPGILDDPLTEKVIGSAIRVHKELGPGFLESVYEEALAVELLHMGVRFERQNPLAITYRGRVVGEHRLDFLVEGTLVIELKAVSAFEKVHYVIVRSYVKAANACLGLLMNFALPTLDLRRVGKEFTGNLPTSHRHD